MTRQRMLMFAGLLLLAGCGKGKPEAVIEDPVEPVPTPVRPSVALDSIVGKWQAAQAAGNGIDWTFLDASLNGKQLLVRITADGKFLPTLAGELSGPFGSYKLDGDTLEVKSNTGQARKLRVDLSGNELTLRDDVGGTQKFTRAPAVAAQVQIRNLPLCCEGCGLTLTKELEKVPGTSDIAIDTKGRSVNLKLADEEQARALHLALHQAGMRGDLVVNGSLLAFSGPTVVADPTGAVKIKEVVLRNVHVCCPECEDNLKKLLKEDVDGKIAFSGDGNRKTLKITGDDLDRTRILTVLSNAGYFFE
ncbi:MAG: hypothetical protein AB7K24_09430 [Gemmataceae bacterium]